MFEGDIHQRLDDLGNFFFSIESFFDDLFGCDTINIALRWTTAGIIGLYSHFLTLIS